MAGGGHHDISHYLAYSGIPTFWRLDHTRDLARVDIAVMGVPYDIGVTTRPGGRFGPRAIRDMSLRAGNFHHSSAYGASERLRIVDYGDVEIGMRTDMPNVMIEDTFEHARKTLSSALGY